MTPPRTPEALIPHRVFLWLLLLMTALLASPARVVADHNQSTFFRVAGDGLSRITGLSADGWLTWSNEVTEGSFLVERSPNLCDSPCEPYTRGTFTNHLWAVKVHDPAPPKGMVFIPGGQFTMGDILGDHTVATPVHQVRVSPFFMQAFEVTNEELREGLQWAHDQGLLLIGSDGVRLAAGATNVLMPFGRFSQEISFADGVFKVKAGRGIHPAVFITWYGSVAYCNFRSQMEGREICYDLSEWSCDFTKQGYRLPTEAEWEFAARGGYEGKRFPWPDTDEITHSRANYRSSTNNAYDVSPTRDFHPDYVDARPRSSPVGTFAPNSYGLYDMCGNVWEWCWDWSARYSSAFQVDPVGPATGTFRIFRGGSWYTTAERVTCAVRYRSAGPYSNIEDLGFRLVLAWQP